MKLFTMRRQRNEHCWQSSCDRIAQSKSSHIFSDDFGNVAIIVLTRFSVNCTGSYSTKGLAKLCQMFCWEHRNCCSALGKWLDLLCIYAYFKPSDYVAC